MIIPYGRQTINKEDTNAVVETLNSEYLTTGPKVREFEDKFARFVGAKYAVAVSSGTAALHLACLAAGLKKGDELITSPMTFAASANCALYCGAKPVFVDIKKENGLIDENLIEKKITPKTKIIIPVHYTGLPCDMKKVRTIAKKHGIIVIEDACHALGSQYKRTKIGDCSYADMVVFSFHPVKHITTGEGGMITTNSKDFYERLLMLRTHGITKDPEKLLNKKEGLWFYEMQELGFNYRITDFQCALGISQLSKVKKFIKKRTEIAKIYDTAFSKIEGVETINPEKGYKNAYHLYVIKTKDAQERLGLYNFLKKYDIHCQVHYIPVYWHPYYQKLGYKKGICPKAEEFYTRILSIPIYYGLKKSDQKKVIKLIKEYREAKDELIVVLGGALKRTPGGGWRSTTFSEGDNFGISGDRYNVIAASYLYEKDPRQLFLASGGKGQYTKITDVPAVAEVVKNELIKLGIPESQIIVEAKSGNTLEQLMALQKIIRGDKRFKRIVIVSNRYHLPRTRAFIDYYLDLAYIKSLLKSGSLKLLAAERVLLSMNKGKWKKIIDKGYSTQAMKDRITLEKHGIEQIKAGTYNFNVRKEIL